MPESPIGEFYHRYPEGHRLHLNKAGEPLFVLPCHAHTFGHIRILFASDAPGPDGRVGWWEVAESPIRDDKGAVIGWKEERNHLVRGNGPDSAAFIPAGWRHQFTLLSMSGYHDCFFHHRNADDEITMVFEGYTHGTH